MPDHNQPTAGPPGREQQDAITAPIGASPAPGAARPGDNRGQTIGPYTLLEVIGEGGFGTVWLAERREPMVQRVALKIIKPGMDSAAVIARFEQERQALAVMDHPNVARVFDGGVTERGLPYFVMEYVKGEPITSFADRKRLRLRQRLELFIRVCDAVQHAHMKGIIHRDLKPSNILVEEIDSVAVVKVIDFGVAKAITQSDWAHTAYTQEGMVIGTPEYMSPEQVLGELDVDTRSDVYSLGVVLYELLTGQLPFASAELRRAGLAEIQRIIREQTPPKPSTRLSESAGERTTAAAAARATSREQLTSELRRELDWVPLMALRKERDRRYPSPQALAEDIQRYLDGRPLRAAPDSRVYLARKFVRRNRVQVGAAAAVFVALTAGLAVALWQRSEAIESQQAEAKQRARADERAAAAEKAEAAATTARDAEKERADQLKKVSDFQSGMLGQIDTTKAGIELMADVRERFVAALEKAGVPEAERTSRVDALRQELVSVNATDAAAAMIDRTILKPAVAAIDKQFKTQPLVDAQLRQALATVYYETLGRYDAALPLQQAALATRRHMLGEEHPDTLESINNMGFLLKSKGKWSDAEPYYRKALEGFRVTRGDGSPEAIISMGNLAQLLMAQNKTDEADQLFRQAVEVSTRALGGNHTESVRAVNNLGGFLLSCRKLEEAEPYLRLTLDRYRESEGEDSPAVIGAINNLGALLYMQGKLAEAERYLRESLEKRRRVQGEEHPATLQSLQSMCQVLRNQGKFAESESLHLETLEKCRRVLGDEHPGTLRAMSDVGTLMQNLGKLEAAELYLRLSMEGCRRAMGEEHPETIIAISNLGGALLARNQSSEAERYCREARELSSRVYGERHPMTLAIAVNLGRTLEHQGQYQRLIELLAPMESAARAVLMHDSPRRFAELLSTIGRARVGIGFDADRFALAEANLLEAYPIYLAAQGVGPTHKDTLACVQALIDLYTAWDKAEPGKGYDLKAAEWKAKLPPAETAKPDTPKAGPGTEPAAEKK